MSMGQLCQMLAQLCYSQLGVQMFPWSAADLPYFSALSEGQRRLVRNDLASYVAICQEALDAGISLKNTGELTKMALNSMGLTPTKEVLSLISDQDVVDVYNCEHQQIFRSFQFFSFCRYSIEELYCRPWPDLIQRKDLDAEKLIFEAITSVLEGSQSLVCHPCRPHWVYQTEYPGEGDIHAEVRFITGLTSEGQNKPQAYAGIWRKLN
ncbi:MAG: hypothetical protein H6624_02560 [Bdellovibrionaceae bacterium]|nr:hypothetical protein [Bdellovibrionales bacterium]MCB9083193.1 hypothetical protein [Pseudobdellovibrionaceae bacterium]